MDFCPERTTISGLLEHLIRSHFILLREGKHHKGKSTVGFWVRTLKLEFLKHIFFNLQFLVFINLGNTTEMLRDSPEIFLIKATATS